MHPPVLPRQSRDDEKPDEREADVDPGEPGEGKLKVSPEADDASLENIAEADEESVDGGLGFVLGLTGGWEEERLANGVLERVVRGVFQGFSPTDEAKQGDEADARVGQERDGRENVESTADADQG